MEGLKLLMGRDAVAPSLLWSEAVSVLHELRWRNSISPELAQTAFERVQRAPIRARRPVGLQREAWNIATRLGWAKTYDAEYVARAQLLRCPPLTIDARLAQTAVREISIVKPTDL